MWLVVAGAEPAMLGQVVTSRAGRDRGDRYVVVEILGDDMVLVVDGEKRTPKDVATEWIAAQ